MFLWRNYEDLDFDLEKMCLILSYQTCYNDSYYSKKSFLNMTAVNYVLQEVRLKKEQS